MLNPEYDDSPFQESPLKIHTIDGSKNQLAFDDGFAMTNKGIFLAVPNPFLVVPYGSPESDRIHINLANRYRQSSERGKVTDLMLPPKVTKEMSFKEKERRNAVVVHLDKSSKYQNNMIQEMIVFVIENKEFSDTPNIFELLKANTACKKIHGKSVLRFPAKNSGKCTEKMVNFFNATFDKVCREVTLAKKLPLLGRNRNQEVGVIFGEESDIRCYFHSPLRSGMDYINMASLLHAIYPKKYALPKESDFYEMADRYNDETL